MRDRTRLAAIAKRDVGVLITGESGTGKEVLAKRIHALSPRSGGPFVAVDCTTLRESLFESQMFGHERGAFTGADRATVGFARCADGGTLMLDEIGELDPTNQARLLRLIQDKTVTPLGSSEQIPVNIRIVAATHRDLWSMADAGEFRKDLLYRLDVVRVHLRPLRERPGELHRLVERLLTELAESYGEDPAQVSVAPDAMELLTSYDWPGNIRELRNAIEHAYVFAETDAEGRLAIHAEHLPERLARSLDGPGIAGTVGSLEQRAEIKPLEVMEKLWVQRALDETGGNKTKAAELLGISRGRLLRTLAESA